MRRVRARANAAPGGEIGFLTTRDLPLPVRREQPHAAAARARPIDKNAHDGSRPHKTPAGASPRRGQGRVFRVLNQIKYISEIERGGGVRRIVAGLGRDR